MISRKNAHKEVTELFEDDLMPHNTLAHDAIDTIYNSIGSCGECKHYLDGWCDKLQYDIARFEMLDIGLTCIKHFERKEDES